MEKDILSKSHAIEKDYQVKILYAVESGSRAWGFASKDSDYDVRFIYAHPVECYLSIEEKSGVIECPVSNLLDINGWDIKKALRLFKKSNPPLYEWLHSPIIYLEQGNFAQQLRKLMSTYYSPISSLKHYFHMAKGNYRDYLTGKRVKVKKYFYVLRPILACMWVERWGTVPPMEFERADRAWDIAFQVEDVQKEQPHPTLPGLNFSEVTHNRHFSLLECHSGERGMYQTFQAKMTIL